MADEYFYGVTLKGENSTVTWSPAEKNAEEEMFSESTVHKLIIKQFLLGVEAKEGEFNVVEVETNAHDEKIKIPIAVLKVGENRCAQSFVEFPDAPVTFKLIQGTGPVHIHGQHLICDESVEGEIPMEDDDDLDEEEDDSDNEIRADDDDEPKAKKSKTAKGKAEKNGKKK